MRRPWCQLEAPRSPDSQMGSLESSASTRRLDRLGPQNDWSFFFGALSNCSQFHFDKLVFSRLLQEGSSCRIVAVEILLQLAAAGRQVWKGPDGDRGRLLLRRSGLWHLLPAGRGWLRGMGRFPIVMQKKHWVENPVSFISTWQWSISLRGAMCLIMFDPTSELAL